MRNVRIIIAAMIVCVCQNVSERDIAKAVAGGCRSFASLQEKLEISKCCGACECAARETFAEHHRESCEVA
jgi:bacterioferritin-associated ferredoxin